jgi:hypothetical protein
VILETPRLSVRINWPPVPAYIPGVETHYLTKSSFPRPPSSNFGRKPANSRELSSRRGSFSEEDKRSSNKRRRVPREVPVEVEECLVGRTEGLVLEGQRENSPIRED